MTAACSRLRRRCRTCCSLRPSASTCWSRSKGPSPCGWSIGPTIAGPGGNLHAGDPDHAEPAASRAGGRRGQAVRGNRAPRRGGRGRRRRFKMAMAFLHARAAATSSRCGRAWASWNAGRSPTSTRRITCSICTLGISRSGGSTAWRRPIPPGATPSTSGRPAGRDPGAVSRFRGPQRVPLPYRRAWRCRDDGRDRGREPEPSAPPLERAAQRHPPSARSAHARASPAAEPSRTGLAVAQRPLPRARRPRPRCRAESPAPRGPRHRSPASSSSVAASRASSSSARATPGTRIR